MQSLLSFSQKQCRTEQIRVELTLYTLTKCITANSVFLMFSVKTNLRGEFKNPIRGYNIDPFRDKFFSKDARRVFATASFMHFRFRTEQIREELTVHH